VADSENQQCTTPQIDVKKMSLAKSLVQKTLTTKEQQWESFSLGSESKQMHR